MSEKQYLQLQNLSAYKKAFELSTIIWDISIQWNHFAKDTIGKQFVRSADSISANIAEGFGRYSKKEKIQFYRYSYGSIQETIDWNNKAYIRNLLSKEQYLRNNQLLRDLPKDLHQLIAFTNEKLTI